MESTALTKEGIARFWALRVSMAVILDALDVLKGTRLLPPGWRLRVHNLETLFPAPRIYDAPRWTAWLLFAEAIVWEATLTFWVEDQGGHSIIPHRSLFGVFLVSLLAVHLA